MKLLTNMLFCFVSIFSMFITKYRYAIEIPFQIRTQHQNWLLFITISPHHFSLWQTHGYFSASNSGARSYHNSNPFFFSFTNSWIKSTQLLLTLFFDDNLRTLFMQICHKNCSFLSSSAIAFGWNVSLMVDITSLMQPSIAQCPTFFCRSKAIRHFIKLVLPANNWRTFINTIGFGSNISFEQRKIRTSVCAPLCH